MDERILQLLGKGLSNVVVANAVGVTESYISQLMAEDAFREKVQELRLAGATAEVDRDSKTDAIRDTILDKLEKSLQYCIKPGELLTAARIVESVARSKSAIPAIPVNAQAQVVNVALPQVVVNNFIKNSNNEIIEVSGRSTTTLSPLALQNMVKAKELANEQSKQSQIGATKSPAEAHCIEAEVAR